MATRTRPRQTTPSQPDLVRIAFKADDLEALIEALEQAEGGLPPEALPVFHHLCRRWSQHELAKQKARR